jgi:Tfp pilus assembly protein PilF
LLAEKQLPLAEALSIVRQVAEALDHAHRRGVIHRDIKPANILLGPNGVQVADFGIARAIRVASHDQVTDSDVVLGTPEYMSPEQGTGARQLDGRADIYALGCVLYCLLAGEPPFTGPTTQAIIARHCQDIPRSVRVIRPSVPVSLERLLMKALAKVPADRFASAADLISAIDEIDLDAVDGIERVAVSNGWTRFPKPWRVAVAFAVTAGALTIAWRMLPSSSATPDTNRIVVFPLHDQRTAADDGGSDAVATYIGYALEETRPLKWLEAGAIVGDRNRDLSNLGNKEASRISRQARAAYFIDGTILRRPDSLTVVLTLHDAWADSVLQTVGASGPLTAYLPQLGLRSVAKLLPAILQPGRTVDLSSLSERSTTAIANFLQGEREYRRMQFRSALKHYEIAISEDSGFGLAAFRGAQTATWLSQPVTDTAMAGLAVRRVEFLGPSQAQLARGLRAYVNGDPDSALVYLRRAVAIDSGLPNAWALMGEVYARSLTSEVPAESLARVALRRARALDRDFAPTLLVLEEMALRDGDLRAARELKNDLARAGADTTHALERKLIWQCVEHGVASVDWAAAARADALTTLGAGRILAGGGAQPDCARAAFTAALQSDSASMAIRNGALLALNGLLLTGGRRRELNALSNSAAAAGLRRSRIYLMDAAIGLGFDREAAMAADSIGRRYDRLDPSTLWHLGSWAARQGAARELEEMTRAMRAKADSSRSRRDVLVTRILNARLVLAKGDTDQAIAQLAALKPTAVRRDVAWQPWAALGVERLLLAELLVARGRYENALRVASQLDATEPVTYLLYLRPSLELRLRAARALGDTKLASRYEARLRGLNR